MQTLKCECDTYLYLTYGEYKEERDGKEFIFAEYPLLVCPECSNQYLPDASIPGKEMAIERGLEDDRDVIYFPDIIQINNGNFIETEVSFKYDQNDYYLIPGLWRLNDNGFLTPIFFNIEVLLKYVHHPQYSLELGANTYGVLYKDKEPFIAFGINRNGKVIMWLGDIDKLNIKEQFYLRSENIKSDHDVYSEFYVGQIEAIFSEPSDEKKVFQQRLGFSEKILNEFNISLSHLEPETIKEARKIVKPIVNTEEAFCSVIIPLNNIFVESINNKDLIKDIKSIDSECDTTGMRSLKLFELWLEKRGISDASNIISPLFILYDLRVAFSHLQSLTTKEEQISYCCERLELPEDCRDFLEIYKHLMKSLIEMYETLLNEF